MPVVPLTSRYTSTIALRYYFDAAALLGVLHIPSIDDWLASQSELLGLLIRNNGHGAMTTSSSRSWTDVSKLFVPSDQIQVCRKRILLLVEHGVSWIFMSTTPSGCIFHSPR
jgi:hypothetical protein